MPVRVLAIEVEGPFLSALSLRWGWKRPVAEAAFLLDLPPDEDEEGWGRAREELQAWRAGRGRPASVVALLSGAEGLASVLRFPFWRMSQVRKVVKAEMEGVVPLTSDEMVVEVLPSPARGAEGRDVLAVAAPKASLARLLGVLGRLGIVPDRVDFAPAAAVKAILALHPSYSGEALWVMYRGMEHLFVAFVREGRPLHIRAVRAERLRGEGEGDLSSEARALAREFQLTLRNWRTVFLGGAEARALVLAGAGGTSSLAQELEPLLGLPCAPVSWQEQEAVEGVGQLSGEVRLRILGALGAGLSSLALSGRRLNFLREEFALREGWGELKRPVAACLAAALIAAGAMTVDLALKVQREEKRLERMQQQVRAAWLEVFPGDTEVTDPRRLITARVQEQARRRRALSGGFDAVGGPLDLLEAMSRALPPSIQVRLSKLRVDAAALSFEGETDTYEAVNRIASSLAREPGFERIEVRQARVAEGGRRVNFSARLPFQAAPGGGRR